MLSEVSNGLDACQGITYKSISDNSSSIYTEGSGATFPLMRFNGPMFVVSELETENGVGGKYEYKYAYEGAKLHRQGKGFLGFSKVTTTDDETDFDVINTYAIDGTYYYPQLTSSITKKSTTTISSTSNIWNEKTFGSSKRFIPYASSSTQTDGFTGK